MQSTYQNFVRSLAKQLKNLSASPRITIAFVLIPSVLYVIRAWQYIATPQLFAEDGAVWLAGAYNHGLQSLFTPYNQFAHTAERLFALIVIHFPLILAPLLFNLGGFALFVLMCYYLFSRRSAVLTTNYQKLFIACSLGLIANFTEFFFNFSNSIFLLGVIGLCIYLAKPSRYAAVRVLEKIGFIIACLTLPFAWFYLLIILFDYVWIKKKKLFYLAVAAIGSVIQLWTYALTASHRPSVPLSILLGSKYIMIEIFNQIITPVLSFARVNSNLTLQAHESLSITAFCILIAGFSLYVVIKHASLELKYLVFFSIAFTAASLRSPIVGGGLTGTNILKFMSTTFEENRYFFYGILCLLLVIALAADTYLKRRASYALLIFFMAFGLSLSIASNSWTIHKNFFVNYSAGYSEGISAFNKSSQGSTIAIPENPVGWTIVLDKK
jgi:hypothetical protein